MANALENLQARLQEILAGRPRQLGWGQPQLMSQSLERARDALGGRRAMGRNQRIARGLMAFRIQGAGTDFVHLKYACQGLALPMDWESRRLLADREQVERLLQRVLDFADDSRRFAACYRGLLASCLHAREAGFPPAGPLAANLQRLEQFLIRAQERLPADIRPLLPFA
ncbi:hypothetical protein [Azovibrio restrictus]|uniref:hypothetical protein n=1 Tax=Azovibrio restrictus TaxID=146938 RepID=UPI0026EF19F0|nr:hypothetical protein [Azovibrio restrictus]